MFADTLAITYNGASKTLMRVNSGDYSSEYLLRETTGEFRLKVRHSSYIAKGNGRTVDRHTVDLQYTVYPVSPATLNTVHHSYFVAENERQVGTADAILVPKGLVGFLTDPNLTKLANLES